MTKDQQVTILAKAIYRSLADKDEVQAKKVINNFEQYLVAHKLLPVLPKVITALKSLYDQESGTVTVEVTSKDTLAKEILNNLEKMMATRLDAGINLENQLDKEILGGIILRYDDKLIDISLKNQINNLAKQLSN
jgi:F-type H+-transporting ATPase subunit delta